MTPRPWNIANQVTLVRIALVPIFAVVFFTQHAQVAGRWLALGIFLIAAASDTLDGYLARSRGLITNLGKLLDPIADKLLMGTALVALSWVGDVPWWISIVIILREVGITVLRLRVVKHVVIAASGGGKIKTVMQSAAIGLYLMPLWDLPSWVGQAAAVTLWLALGLTVITGLDYLYQYWRAGRYSRLVKTDDEPGSGTS